MVIIDTTIEELPVRVYENRKEMGAAAAREAARQIRQLIAQKGEANVIFAAAPSQQDALAALLQEDIDWSAVRGFHQDEYVGIPADAPAQFGNFLRRHLFDKASFKALHFMECEKGREAEKCAEYAALLQKFPPDIIFLGFGENGHLAFNDPPVADFNDPLDVKVVQLDETCRRQQVNDGCFATLEEVPTHAMTLTMPRLFRVPSAIAVVPTGNKANAVRDALRGPVSTSCPASILRTHPNAALYLEAQSAAKAFNL